MIPFKINGIRYHIPTCWYDVSYSQCQELVRPTTLTDQIAIFTGIPRETLETSELKNLEKISLALSFLSFAPDFTKRSKMVGPYTLPEDVTVKSTRQFEALRVLMMSMPKDLGTIESTEKMNDFYLQACAVYVQKLQDGTFDPKRVPQVAEQLKAYSCVEVIGTGAFFLFRPIHTLPPTMNFFQRFMQRLKRLRRV